MRYDRSYLEKEPDDVNDGCDLAFSYPAIDAYRGRERHGENSFSEIKRIKAGAMAAISGQTPDGKVRTKWNTDRVAWSQQKIFPRTMCSFLP